MSTRRQRRSPKWLKRQRQRHGKTGGAMYARDPFASAPDSGVLINGEYFPCDPIDPESFKEAVMASKLVMVDLTWDSVTITPPAGSSFHCEVKRGEVLEPVHVHLNRAQRRARGLL